MDHLTFHGKWLSQCREQVRDRFRNDENVRIQMDDEIMNNFLLQALHVRGRSFQTKRFFGQGSLQTGVVSDEDRFRQRVAQKRVGSDRDRFTKKCSQTKVVRPKGAFGGKGEGKKGVYGVDDPHWPGEYDQQWPGEWPPAQAAAAAAPALQPPFPWRSAAATSALSDPWAWAGGFHSLAPAGSVPKVLLVARLFDRSRPTICLARCETTSAPPGRGRSSQ